MSAMDFEMDVQKEDPNGDGVVVTSSGKFLPYKKWSARPERQFVVEGSVVSLWITAYCCRPVGPLDCSALKESIKKEMPTWADWYSRISVTRSGELLHLNYQLRKDALYDGVPAASRARVRGGVPIVLDPITD